MKIKILSGTHASGVSYLPGKFYTVGKDVSEADAKIFIKLKRAEEVTPKTKSSGADDGDAGGDAGGNKDDDGAGNV